MEAKHKIACEFMDANHKEYQDALDLAADCCSEYSYWNDENMSIPVWLIELAKEYFT